MGLPVIMDRDILSVLDRTSMICYPNILKEDLNHKMHWVIFLPTID